MEKFGYTWNKPGTSHEENKIIAEIGLKKIEDNTAESNILDKEDTDYLDYAHPKTNDDFHNEEITNRRIIEGYDMYDKLSFSTEEQKDLKKSLEDKKDTDYAKAWNEYENLVNRYPGGFADSDHETTAANLRSYETAIDTNIRFRLAKGESLTDKEIKYLEEKIRKSNEKSQEYEALRKQYDKTTKSLSDRYDHWDTEPGVN